MGRRVRRNQIQDALDAFNQTYSIGKQVAQDKAMSDIASATPETDTGYTQDQGDQINAIANAKDENGQPYYNVTPGDNGSYQVQANFGNNDVAQIEQGTRTTFLGNTTPGTMTKEQADSARLQAMAGVKSRFGDPMSAVRLRSAANEMAVSERKLADDEEMRSAMSSATADPKTDLNNYLKQVAPKAIATMVQQGRVGDAKHFADFVDTEEGRSYSAAWLKGVRSLAIGDHAGALNSFQDMYNRQLYNDGQSAKLEPLDDGKSYRITVSDADGKVVGSQEMPTTAMAENAALVLDPTNAAKFHAEQQAKRLSEAATMDRQEMREDRRDARLAARLTAESDRRGTGGNLSLSQQRSNAEIDAARDAVSGLSPEEIRKRTAKTTDTGRENPSYDPALSRAASLANRRKVGDDPTFDSRQGGGQPASVDADRADVAKRFRSDRAMDGYTLGKVTPDGVEVLKKGAVVGHYR